MKHKCNSSEFSGNDTRDIGTPGRADTPRRRRRPSLSATRAIPRISGISISSTQKVRARTDASIITSYEFILGLRRAAGADKLVHLELHPNIEFVGSIHSGKGLKFERTKHA